MALLQALVFIAQQRRGCILGKLGSRHNTRKDIPSKDVPTPGEHLFSKRLHGFMDYPGRVYKLPVLPFRRPFRLHMCQGVAKLMLEGARLGTLELSTFKVLLLCSADVCGAAAEGMCGECLFCICSSIAIFLFSEVEANEGFNSLVSSRLTTRPP